MERKIADGAERKELHRIVLFVLAFVVTIVCIGTGSIQQRETVQVGSVATKRYVAPEDTVMGQQRKNSGSSGKQQRANL